MSFICSIFALIFILTNRITYHVSQRLRGVVFFVRVCVFHFSFYVSYIRKMMQKCIFLYKKFAHIK